MLGRAERAFEGIDNKIVADYPRAFPQLEQSLLEPIVHFLGDVERDNIRQMEARSIVRLQEVPLDYVRAFELLFLNSRHRFHSEFVVELDAIGDSAPLGSSDDHSTVPAAQVVEYLSLFQLSKV